MVLSYSCYASHGRFLAAGLVGLAIYLYVRPALQHRHKEPGITPSPARTVLPKLSEVDLAKLPYPPGVFPGARNVETPYGVMKVAEFGDEKGEKVLLLHGIGTPCVALGEMAERFVECGCRVMLFDFFGRGYSDAPNDIPYDARLYASQILLALASSDLPWTGASAFHLAGYSLGGAIAASFARYHPRMVRSLTLICPGGLVRVSHRSWKDRLLYSEGFFPERLLSYLVGRRLRPTKKAGDVPEAELVSGVKEDGEPEMVGFNDVRVSRRRSTTVADVVGWQAKHHRGYVVAYMSTIRNAPIYEQGDRDWAVLREVLAARRGEDRGADPGLEGGKVCLVLGTGDSVVVMDECVEDARRVLGDEAVEVVAVEGGHEVAISRGREIAEAMMGYWGGRDSRLEVRARE